MLNELRGAVATLLMTAVCGLLFRFLLPEGNVSRTAKVIVSLVTLCAVCAPLFGVWGRLSGKTELTSGFPAFHAPETTFPSDSLERRAAEAVEAVCETIVLKYTVAPHEIAAAVHITETGGIEIEQIRIVFAAAPDRLEAMTAELTEACGAAPEIRVESADE